MTEPISTGMGSLTGQAQVSAGFNTGYANTIIGRMWVWTEQIYRHFLFAGLWIRVFDLSFVEP